MDKIINLSITTKNVPVRMDVVQYATKPDIVFTLDDYTPSNGAMANLYIEKPDGTLIYNGCAIEGNKITYTPTTQSFGVVGTCKCQLQIIETDGTAVSFLIYADVTPNIIDSEAIESADEYTALEEAIQTIGDITGDIQTAQQTADGAVDRLDNLGNEKLTFTEAEVDTTISDNLTLSTIFGRIKRLFTRTSNVESAITIEDSVLTAFQNDGWTRPSGGVISSLFSYLLGKVKAAITPTPVTITRNETYVTSDWGYTAQKHNGVLDVCIWFKTGTAAPAGTTLFTASGVTFKRWYGHIYSSGAVAALCQVPVNNTIIQTVGQLAAGGYWYIGMTIPIA